MKVALAHDYLVQGMRGAERCLAIFHEIWPEAPIYTLVHDPEAMGEPCRDWDVRTSFLQKIPGGVRHYQKLIALMPRAIESLDMSPYDVIVSDSSAWPKSLIFREDAIHVCYCHSPARFLWHWSDEYLATARGGRVQKAIAKRIIPRLRDWDLRTCRRPTHYLANSRTAQSRIKEHWGIDSEVILPPVDTHRLVPDDIDEEHFLVVGALNAYKRVDLAIEAFNELGLPLVVVGDGPMREQLEAVAKPNVRLAGKVSDEELQQLYGRCRGFVMPQIEDFGIAPVEAMSAGRPVVAFGQGGALETVLADETGVFFDEQTPTALIDAVRRFEGMTFSKKRCRDRALEFDTEIFRQRIRDYVSQAASTIARP